MGTKFDAANEAYKMGLIHSSHSGFGQGNHASEYGENAHWYQRAYSNPFAPGPEHFIDEDE